MRASTATQPTRRGKRRLLESCAIAASLIALAHGGPSRAQVAGTGQVVSGSGTISPPAALGPTAPPNSTQVEVATPQTIINWTPTDNAPTGGAIDFLPAGNTLEFYGTGDYTVLNRFVDAGGGSLARQVALNGTVNSYIGSRFATGGNVQGGNIWFYNAGGILIGNSAAINVGSLLLTANDIDTTGGLFGGGGEIRFRGAAGTSGIQIASGATVNAAVAGNPGGSYVALVAPRIVQSGAVRVDGSAAYVAAEQADIRINGGLFDIDVLVGADGGNAIVHDGSTTGPAHQQGDFDQSRIYMVAIPKNDAVTMLVAGEIGYDDAVVAQADPDGAVVLSAGYGVTAGQIDADPASDVAANITVGDTLFRSSTTAHASGAFVGQPANPTPPAPLPGSPAQGLLWTEGDASFTGDASATLVAAAGQQVGADGGLVLQSGGTANAPGQVVATVVGGQLAVGGNLELTASGRQQADGSSIGGDVGLSITDGDVQAGSVYLTSTGQGGIGVDGSGGDGVGGSASLLVSGAATLVAGDIAVQSVGRGGGLIFSNGFATGAADIGGDGTGGTATLAVENGASLVSSDGISVGSTGFGQTGAIQSGTGTGGIAALTLTGSGSTIASPSTSVSADGFGGQTYSQPILPDVATQNGGDGLGGAASMTFTGDELTGAALGDTIVSASGEGGGSSDSDTITGGDARGGTVTVSLAGPLTVTTDAANLFATALSGGGTSLGGTTAISGNAQGGSVDLAAADFGVFQANGDLMLAADGTAGISESLGSGTGGSIGIGATGNAAIRTLGQLSAQANGGNGAAVTAIATGDGTGGTVDIAADGGTLGALYYSVHADGQTVNAQGSGGIAQGGSVAVLAANGGLIEATDSVPFNTFSAQAQSGASLGGAAAIGGTMQIIADAGTIRLPGYTSLSTGGVAGGNFDFGGPAPTGRGGTLVIRTVAEPSNGSSLAFDDLQADADGSSYTDVEGSPGSGTGAGNGLGGNVTVDIQGGSLSIANAAYVSADGYGGGVGPNSGTGTGGTVAFTQGGGDVTAGDLYVSADGFGGFDPVAAGDGFGGTATMTLAGGTLTAADVIVSADGVGQYGFDGDDSDTANILAAGDGGNGTGGTAAITLDGNALVETSTLAALATGTGGDGGSFFNYNGTVGAGGDAGSGTGGSASVDMLSGTLTTSSLAIDSGGSGGAGGSVLEYFSSGTIVSIGVGGRGASGQGGTSTLTLATDVEPGATVTVASQGTGGGGGSGSTGGNGGGAGGGTARIVVTDHDTGTLLATVDASANGGAGGYGDNGAGGDGGDATGGTGRVEAMGPNARVAVTQANFITGGRGGNGAFANSYAGSDVAIGPAGGSGGDGTGGTIEAVASEGAVLTLAPDTNSVVAFGSTGTGGDGGNGAFNNYGTGLSGGAGGDSGSGSGGTVHLLANGGTVTSDGEAVTIDVNGVAGTAGSGGSGTDANGAAGLAGTTAGGRAIVEARVTSGSTAQVDLGDTRISANGDMAGRIELISDGAVTFASLAAETLGAAAPTNNDTGAADTGIFVGVYGGTVRTTGAATLVSDGSVGVYGQANGVFDVGANLDIQAADQVDIRHDDRAGAAPTIEAGGDLTAIAGTGISGSEGSLLDAGGTLTLTATAGGIGVDRLHGADIFLDSAGATRVEHAEADTDLTARAASFATGLNSIVTGGNIDINAPGTVNLGNSTAGGYVFVVGQSIAFNAIEAGSTVALNANGFGAADGIDGVDIAAGGPIVLSGRHVAVAGTVSAPDTLAISASAGNALVGVSDVGGDISVSASDNIDGIYRAGGNVTLTAGGDLTAETDATGGYIDGNGNVSEGYVLVNADNTATLTNSSAATMLAVRAGNAASLNGATAGEDVFVLAGTTADLAAVTAGDDIDVTSGSGLAIADAVTTGSGSDARSVVYSAIASNPIPVLHIDASPPDLSNITLSAPAATIVAADLSAFDNLIATAAGAVTGAGTLRSGLATSISGSSLALGAIAAGTDIDLISTGGRIASTGALAAGHDVTIAAATDVDIAELDAGDDIDLAANGSVTVGAAYADGSGLDDESDGSNIDIVGGATSVGHAEAAGDFTATVASFATGTASIITGGDIVIDAPGAADLGNATAGGSIDVGAQSIAFVALDAGTTLDLTAIDVIAGSTITAGGTIRMTGGSIAVADIAGDASLYATATGGQVAIGQADVAGFIEIDAAGDIQGSYASGGDISMESGGDVTASATATGGFLDPATGLPSAGNLFVDAAADATLADSVATGMFGVNAGDSVTLTGGGAGEDLFVRAGTTAVLANVTAGDDIDAAAAGGLTATGLSTTGGGSDDSVLGYDPATGFTIGNAAPDGADITLLSANGAIAASDLSAGDDILLSAASTIDLDGADTLGLGIGGGDSSIRSQGTSATLANLDAADDVVIQATGAISVDGPVAAGRDIAMTGASTTLATLTTPAGALVDTLAAGRNVAVTTSSAVDGGAIAAFGTIALSAGDSIDVGRVMTQGTGGIGLNGTNGVAVDTIVDQGTTILASANGAIVVGSLASAGSVEAIGDSIAIGGNGDLDFTGLVADVGDAIVGTNGNLSIAGADVAGFADFGGAQELSVTTLAAGDARLVSTGGDIALTDASVTGSLDASAGGLIAIDGAVSAAAMTLASHDIAIGTAGQIGSAGTTTSLSISNNGVQQSFIGGDGSGDGYNLDADEMARLYGSDIRIFAPVATSVAGNTAGGRPVPDAVIGAFTMTGGDPASNLGAAGSLTIETAGRAEIAGAVVLTGLSDDNALAVVAGAELDVALGEGSIRLSGSDAATPGGRLTLDADTILVATRGAMADIDSATSTDAIEDRLAQSDGFSSDDGALFARGIDASANTGFYVQNSGAGTDFDQRRGLTFGAGGFNVNTAGAGTRLVLNGVQLGPQGQVTGLDTIALLSIGGGTPTSAGLDARSTLNGCIILNSGACARIATPDYAMEFPVQDVIEGEVGTSGSPGDGILLPTALITIRDIDPMTGAPLLDDPVTGAGNDDLWTAPDRDEDSEDSE